MVVDPPAISSRVDATRDSPPHDFSAAVSEPALQVARLEQADCADLLPCCLTHYVADAGIGVQHQATARPGIRQKKSKKRSTNRFAKLRGRRSGRTPTRLNAHDNVIETRIVEDFENLGGFGGVAFGSHVHPKPLPQRSVGTCQDIQRFRRRDDAPYDCENLRAGTNWRLRPVWSFTDCQASRSLGAPCPDTKP